MRTTPTAAVPVYFIVAVVDDHSFGEKRATMKIVKLTSTYDTTHASQISTAKGFRKLNNWASRRFGTLNRMEIPRFLVIQRNYCPVIFSVKSKILV